MRTSRATMNGGPYSNLLHMINCCYHMRSFTSSILLHMSPHWISGSFFGWICVCRYMSHLLSRSQIQNEVATYVKGLDWVSLPYWMIFNGENLHLETSTYFYIGGGLACVSDKSDVLQIRLIIASTTKEETTSLTLTNYSKVKWNV